MLFRSFNIKVKKVRTKGCESVVYGNDAFHYDPDGSVPLRHRPSRG